MRALDRVAEMQCLCAIILSLTGLNTDEGTKSRRMAAVKIGQAQKLCAVGLHLTGCFGQ